MSLARSRAHIDAVIDGPYGFSREELIGHPIKRLVAPERHVQARSLLVRWLAGEEVRNVEGLRWDRNGTVVPVLLTLSALRDESGAIAAVVTIAKDITRQKQTEEELARARENGAFRARPAKVPVPEHEIPCS